MPIISRGGDRRRAICAVFRTYWGFRTAGPGNMCDFWYISAIQAAPSIRYVRFFVQNRAVGGPTGTICVVFRTYWGFRTAGPGNMCDFSYTSAIQATPSIRYVRFFVQNGSAGGPTGRICVVFHTYRGTGCGERGDMCGFSHILGFRSRRAGRYVWFFVHIGVPDAQTGGMCGYITQVGRRATRKQGRRAVARSL